MRRPTLAGIALIGSLLIVGGALGLWKFAAVRAAANKPPFEPPEFVDFFAAETVSWRPTARLVGTVIAKRSITLSNEIVGVVTDVNFRSGDLVEPGQVLVKLDVSTELADLAAAEAAERIAKASIGVAQANVRSSESALELAKSMHQRLIDAAKSESVSAIELDKDRSALESAIADVERERSSLARAEAEHEQAIARVAQIRTLLAKKSLASPFRARAGMRTVHPGQYVAEGTDIVELTELTDDIFVDFAVPQEYAARVEPGVVVAASSKMLGSEDVPILVVSIDATVNPVTRNVRVRSSIPNAGHRLKPGMFIDVEVPVEAARPVVVIPATAVRRAAFGDHVYLLEPGDPQKDAPGSFRARQRIVSLGPDIGGRVIVTSGVVAGDTIAASGSFKLREGALVMKSPTPHAQAAQPAVPEAETTAR